MCSGRVASRAAGRAEAHPRLEVATALVWQSSRRTVHQMAVLTIKRDAWRLLLQMAAVRVYLEEFCKLITILIFRQEVANGTLGYHRRRKPGRAEVESHTQTPLHTRRGSIVMPVEQACHCPTTHPIIQYEEHVNWKLEKLSVVSQGSFPKVDKQTTIRQHKGISSFVPCTFKSIQYRSMKQVCAHDLHTSIPSISLNVEDVHSSNFET